MNSLVSIFLIAPLIVNLSLAGPFFKAGLIKGALKGILKGHQQNEDNRQCQVKWEEVWKPHCSTSYEKVTASNIKYSKFPFMPLVWICDYQGIPSNFSFDRLRVGIFDLNLGLGIVTFHNCM